MFRIIYIFIISFGIISFSYQSPKILAKYQKFNDSDAANNHIFLYKNGTFLTRLAGGCDGTIETRGKWSINKDTLSFTEIEGRIFTDPWKKTKTHCKYLIKNQNLTAFTIVENKIILDKNDLYKKVRSKKKN